MKQYICRRIYPDTIGFYEEEIVNADSPKEAAIKFREKFYYKYQYSVHVDKYLNFKWVAFSLKEFQGAPKTKDGPFYIWKVSVQEDKKPLCYDFICGTFYL